MFSRLRVSNNGNLIETTHYAAGKIAHRVVLNTAGLGDRRVRKAAAREELRRRLKAKTKNYYEIVWMAPAVGALKSCNLSITLKI